MNLENKTIIVTGGGNGMGRAICLNLLSKGCHVIAIDINKTALDETEKLAGNMLGRFCPVVLDITNLSSINNWISECSFIREIDGLINNAGIIQPFVSIENIELSVAQRLFNVNFWGAFNMIQSLLPFLKLSPSAHIVNVSSMGGFLPIPGQAVYGASKAALKILSESLSEELRSSTICVTTAFPGALNTEIKKNSGLENSKNNDSSNAESLKQALSPVVAAEILVHAMEENLKEVYIGEDCKTLNHIYRTDPNAAIRLISSKINHKL